MRDLKESSIEIESITLKTLKYNRRKILHKNKEEIKAYYETHFLSPKEIATFFDMPKRTIYEWISKEGWEIGKSIPKEPINPNELIKDEFGTRLSKAKNDLKDKIKNNLINSGISEIIAEATAKKTSDNMLLQAMSMEFLDTKATEALLISKNAFEKFANANINNPSAQAKIIAMSKNMVEMYSSVKSTIYGKNPEVSINIANINSTDSEIKKLSDKELLEIIAKENNE